MMKFDEANVKSQLVKLGSRFQICFALAAASRLLPYYKTYCSIAGIEVDERPQKYQEELWRVATGEVAASAKSDLEGKITNLLAIMPSEDDAWNETLALAEDAVASLVYAYRCLLFNDPQEAVWAARRAYEAADQYAINQTDIDLNDKAAERKILSHPVVQGELSRQARDLELARRGDDLRLRQLASIESLLDNFAN